MNASILILGTALAVGGDAPIVVGAGCSGCGAPSVSYTACAPDVCHPMPSCGRVGLLDRLRAKLAGWRAPKASCAHAAACCAPAPACCTPAPVACAPAPCAAPAPCTPACGTPVFTGFTTSCADPCHKSGLLDRLRAKFKGSRSCDACAAPLACGSCDNCSGGWWK